MGLTLIERSGGSRKPRRPRVALVLAGGAVSGGAFKVGGLKALEECLVGRSVTEFDTYVGLSSGSFLAVALAGGISPDEMAVALGGDAGRLEGMRAFDLYRPNAGELLARTGRFWAEAGLVLPGLLLDLARALPALPATLRRPVRALLDEPTAERAEQLLAVVGRELAPRRSLPSPQLLMPSGLFDNAPLSRWLERQMQRLGIPERFDELHRERGRKLFISATELDSGNPVVFGPEADRGLTIAQAVQASSALPGFMRPARFDGVDYVDGGVRHTADIHVAVEEGADLIICLNALRPILNPSAKGPLADRGLMAVVSQAVRALLHARLDQGLRAALKEEDFKGDLILIEAGEQDSHFFDMNPLVPWGRRDAVAHGLESVRRSLGEHGEALKPVFARYGIEFRGPDERDECPTDPPDARNVA